MEYIAHRINKIEELRTLPVEYGVELDLRDGLDERIYIEHNPFIGGEDFEDYLKEYHHGTMILNIKSERIELEVLKLLEKYHIENYFFLDSSFPMIKLLSDMGETDVALRYSEFEGMDTIRNMSGRVKWIWVDCFTKFPLDESTYEEMKKLGYRLCFVSPELQGQSEKIEEYANQSKSKQIFFDAICTKSYNIDLWKDIYKR